MLVVGRGGRAETGWAAGKAIVTRQPRQRPADRSEVAMLL
jgi:hypothetical protein